MKKTKFQNRLRLMILLGILVLSLTTFAVGKYITSIEKTGTITFTSRLADSIVIREHRAVPQADGSYVLDMDGELVENNSYRLIPGLDVPKDPHIIIEEKTKIQAYLYLEVVDNTPNGALRYGLRDSWIPSSALSPKHGGTVYVYSTDKTKAAVLTSDPGTVYILKDDMFYVDQALLSGEKNNGLTFYAYLIETTNS